MPNAFEFDGFVVKDGIKEPLYVVISAPATSDAEEYFCHVHAPALLTKDAQIFGIDAFQAQELAVGFVQSFLDGVEVFDHDGEPIEWP